MRIGYDFLKNEIIKDEEKAHVPSEEEAIDIIMNDLGISNYEVVKNSDDYTTLVYRDYDLFRIKYTPKAHWINIIIFPSMKKEYSDSPLFSSQANKNQMYWKSNIYSLFDYKEVLLASINEINKQ